MYLLFISAPFIHLHLHTSIKLFIIFRSFKILIVLRLYLNELYFINIKLSCVCVRSIFNGRSNGILMKR